jgi:hypothetical protein
MHLVGMLLWQIIESVEGGHLMRRLLSPVLGSLLIVSLQATGADFVPPKTDDELMANALSAAPAAVAATATVIAFDEKGNIRTLRQGTG